MAKIIKTVDWNNHTYTFENRFYNTGTKSHDILIMRDENGKEWSGETTWINRPWHRFDLEEAWFEIVGKAFGKKAQDLASAINKNAHSVEDAIDTFFKQFKLEDTTAGEPAKDSTPIDEQRVKALANYLEIPVSDVKEQRSPNEFDTPYGTYRVLTDEEADEEFDQSVRNLWDEIGLDGVSGWTRDWILENALDDSDFENFVREDAENVVYDMSDSELIAELINEGMCTEDDFYDEDYNIKEDVDLDHYREELIDKKVDDDMQSQTFAEYLQNVGFEDDYIAKYIDEEKAIEAIKDDIDTNGTGRSQELAYYDGDEIELSDGLFAYRIG